MPVGGRTPSSVPRVAGHPFLAGGPPSHGPDRDALREESHFKFGEINKLGSGGGTKPVIIIFLAKKLVKSPKKIGPRPKNKGGPKVEKKVVFWHKKCEKFRIRHPHFFSQKIFNPPMRPKRHFAPKCTCPTIVTPRN